MSCSPPKPGLVKQIVAITPYAFHLGIYSNGERSKPIVTSGIRDTRKGHKVIYSITGYLVAQANKVGVRAPNILIVGEHLKQMNETLLP